MMRLPTLNTPRASAIHCPHPASLPALSHRSRLPWQQPRPSRSPAAPLHSSRSDSHDTEPITSIAPMHVDTTSTTPSSDAAEEHQSSGSSTAAVLLPEPEPATPASPAPHLDTPSTSSLPPFPPGLQIQSVLPSTSTLSSPSASPSPSPSSKPFMLLLPDLDGAGMTSRRSWPALSQTFDLQVLTLSPDYALTSTSDSPFQDLLAQLTHYLRSHLDASPPERPVYLLGEGFGSVLAVAAALDCPAIIHRLLLVNPSTSYLSSPLRRLEPLLQSGFPSPLDLGLSLALAPALVANVDPFVAASALLEAGGGQGGQRSSAPSGGGPGGLLQRAVAGGLELLRRGPVEVAGETLKLARSTLEEVREVSKNLPPEALRLRLRMLGEGVKYVEPRLVDVEQRTMVLVGGRDPVLPSGEEGKRLVKLMQRAFVKLLPDSGRCPLSEPEVDVLEVMRQEGFLTQRRVFTSDISSSSSANKGSNYGGARPLELPSLQEVQRAGTEWTASIRSYCSPVFFSTLEDGTIVEGLEGLPADERPLLVVGNHQLYAFDMNIMVEEVLLKRGILLRGLAHPSLFDLNGPKQQQQQEGEEGEQQQQQQQQQEKKEEGGLPRSLSNTYQTFGAVEVSAKNFYKLLRQKEAVLLYPGGVREGFKRKQEKYELFWPSKPEFVRMAARFSSTVVPLAAIGLEDSISLVLDSDELLSNPLLGQRSREMSAATRMARAGVAQDPDHDQSFVPPIIAPQIPARLYFLFGRPIRLDKQLYDDRPAAQRVYAQMRSAVEDGMGWLLRKREQDPYKDFLQRYLYENLPLGGPKRKAPTFTPK